MSSNNKKCEAKFVVFYGEDLSELYFSYMQLTKLHFGKRFSFVLVSRCSFFRSLFLSEKLRKLVLSSKYYLLFHFFPLQRINIIFLLNRLLCNSLVRLLATISEVFDRETVFLLNGTVLRELYPNPKNKNIYLFCPSLAKLELGGEIKKIEDVRMMALNARMVFVHNELDKKEMDIFSDKVVLMN